MLPAIPGAAPGGAGRAIISLAVFFAVLIALLWVLASWTEELASARTEARLFVAQAVTDPLMGLANRQLDDGLAERCRARVADATFREAGHITASFGVATLVAEDDARSLLRRADQALYRAKNEGRDRVVGSVEDPGRIVLGPIAVSRSG